MSKVYRYSVTFKPKAGWVDNIYLGNLLGEVLSTLANQTDAFEFELQYLEGGEAGPASER